MSELRKLEAATQYLFKDVCNKAADTPHPNDHIRRVKGFLGQALEVLSRLAAEQEALSPAPQTARAEQSMTLSSQRLADGLTNAYENGLRDGRYESAPKGSGVEYYKDQLFKTAEIVADLADSMGFWNPLRSALNEYKEALSADPDPEGSWEWVPNTHLVAPKMITSVMCAAGQNAAEDKIDCVEVGQIYRAILAARPPVPKKGESV